MQYKISQQEQSSENRLCRNASRRTDRQRHRPGLGCTNYGPGAGAKPDGVVAVTPGVATVVSGVVGGVVVAIVCPVTCGATGPTTCSGSAELTLPKATPSAPMATSALTPIVADPNFHCGRWWLHPCFPCGVSVPAARRYLPGRLILKTTWQTHTGWLMVVRVLRGAVRRLAGRMCKLVAGCRL